jgi:hypothetical protein
MQGETQRPTAAQDDVNSHFNPNFSNENGGLPRVEPEKEISQEA